MTGVDGEREVAAEHLRADLIPKRARWLRAIAEVALGAVGGHEVIPQFDLVVTRLDNGRQVLRTSADTGDPYFLLGQVELDLETKTVEEFLAEWRPAD